jgi:hypothetical protein
MAFGRRIDWFGKPAMPAPRATSLFLSNESIRPPLRCNEIVTRFMRVFHGSFIMLRRSTIVITLSLCLNVMASNAQAQFMFPRGYGGYGMSQWGANPSAGYMAGLGSFARGKGSYLVDKAQADAINVDTMAKWNKALRARQLAVREDQRKEAATRDAARNRRVERMDLRDGITLNNLLAQIFDIDPTAVKSGRANSPINMRAIREIPFEWDSEAITLCLDQMMGRSSLPAPLMAPMYAEEREALQAAVQTAVKEDVEGSVSIETSKRINEALAKFRAKFTKNTSNFDLGYDDALTYFTTMASLSRLLNDPSMKRFLEKLQNNEERTVGDLIAFMDSYNLRFGPATSDRQLSIYTGLVPILTAIRDSVKTVEFTPSEPDRTGEGLKAAAKEAFKPMKWDQLEAHARDH